MTALSSDTLTPEQEAQAKERLQAILDVVGEADKHLGIGNDVSAGIAQGMNAYGWQGDAGTLATSIETAIRSATATQSPSQMTVPIGEGIAQGIGQGMSAYSFAAEAAAMAGGLKGSITGAMPNMSSEGAQIGRNFTSGMASGIRAGKSSVISAAIEVARAAVNAARSELQESSPSRVGRDIGANYTKGIALGVLDDVGQVDKATRKALLPMTSDVLDELEGQLNARLPNVMGALQSLEYRAMGIGQAASGGGGAYSAEQGTTRNAPGIDYERMADAVAARPVSLSVGGRQLASTTAVDNSLAVTKRGRRIAFGYGGKR